MYQTDPLPKLNTDIHMWTHVDTLTHKGAYKITQIKQIRNKPPIYRNNN